ncbi:protein of unknown function [Candidatus Nitrotoga arctica]|uniref:Uncharacterized protein n=1 Tax=Candidatus Nitrotoga arctica TaxID=453162 RepID=A0ABM8YYS4_9PROT|nr:protein of unknown function [Candidatus Nitrotoga arctica]
MKEWQGNSAEEIGYPKFGALTISLPELRPYVYILIVILLIPNK